MVATVRYTTTLISPRRMPLVLLLLSGCLLALLTRDCAASLSMTLSPSSDVTALKFKFVYISCQVNSSHPYNITWRRDGTVITKKPPPFIISWNKGSVLMVRPLFLTFSGYYECQAQNGHDPSIRKGIRINVKEAGKLGAGFPSLFKSSGRSYVDQFDTLKLVCVFNGTPLPTVSWFFRRGPVDFSDPRITMLSDNTLQIKNASTKDQGFYECQGLNEHGVSYSIEIYTFVKKYVAPTPPPAHPRLIVKAKDVVVVPESDVTLKCNATGYPPPKFVWYRNAELIGGGSNGIQVVQYILDSANYTCKAVNSAGSVNSSCSVTVLKIPLTPRDPEFVSRTPHSITIKWEDSVLKRFTITNYIMKYRKAGTTTWLEKSIPYTDNKEFTLSPIGIFQFYEFQVFSANSIGTSYGSNIKKFFSGETIPSTPARNLLAWGLSDTEANVTWLPPAITNGRVGGYRIFYSTNEELEFKYWYKYSTALHHARLRRLQPRAVYFYKIQVFSLRGDGPFTNVSVFKAQKGAPGQVQAVKVTHLTSSSVVINWNTPIYKGDGLDGYEISYNTSGTTVKTHSIDTVKETGTIKRLRPYTYYRFKVAARSFAGLGPLSRSVVVRTLEDIPSAPPKDVRGFPKSSTSLEVLWEPPPLEHRNGAISGYRILYTESLTASPSIMVVNATRTKALLTGLRKYTKYTIWVLASNSLGDGPPSSKFEIFTDEDVPEGAPRQVRAETLNSSSFSVSWLEPIEKSGRIRGYVVYYLPMTDDHKLIPFRRTTLKFIADGADKRFAIVNQQVEPLTTYRIQVGAYTVVGEGTRSPYTFIKTPKRKPPPPRVNIVTPDELQPSILIKWRPRIAGVTQYRVVYGKSLRQYDSLTDVQTKDFPATIRQELFGNLSYGVWYCFRVSESTVDGWSAESTHWVLTADGKPTGWPRRVEAITETASSIKVKWSSPDPWKESGLIVKYRIRYKKVGDKYRYSIYDGSSLGVMSKIVGKLDASTEYIIGIQAYTTIGPGPFSPSVMTTTNNEVLPVVENLTITEVSSTTAFVRWKTPTVLPHIQILSYRLTYRGSKSYRSTTGKLLTIISLDSKEVYSTSFELQDLLPALRYRVELVVITSAGAGEAEIMMFTTENALPPSLIPPSVPSTTPGSKSVIINLVPASDINGAVEYYLLFVVNLGTDKSRIDNLLKKPPADYKADVRSRRSAIPDVRVHIAKQFRASELPTKFNIGDGSSNSQYTNHKLVVGSYYVFFLRAYIRQSGDDNGYMSMSSGFTDVMLYASSAAERKSGGSMVWIAGVAVGVLAVIGCLIVFVILIRRRRLRYGTSEEQKPLRRSSSKNKPRDLVELHRMTNQTPGIINHPPIPLAAFERHCAVLKESEGIKFVREYESIDLDRTFSSDASVQSYNRMKNRYPNVLAYDHTRVKLQPTGELGSDYINANFIDGYCRERAYIATQGPMPTTVDDFWRACWEQKSASIVMMTELEERGRGKCEQYWPSSGSITFGNVRIGLKESLELCYFTIRTLEVADIDSNEVREIKHFQFTAWPDIGVPLDEGPLLAFIRCVKSSTPSDSGPIVVHCSAGVGRTACFIVIHSMLERIAHDNTIDIYGYVTMLRSQRNFTMQSEEQYMFVHDAILEAIHSDTEVPPALLLHHFKRLMELTKSSGGRQLDEEFSDIVRLTMPDPCNCLTAQIVTNKCKNRCETIIPYDSNRVSLQQPVGQELSDYINASFIDGYRSRRAYIATQGPVKSTANDFWRMVIEQNCSVIVMLSRLEEQGKEQSFKYWPTEKSVHYHFYVVEPVSEMRQVNFITREFKVKDARDGSLRVVRQFQFTNWPKGGAPLSTSGVIELIGQVQEAQNQLCSGGPILVHSNTGAGRTGVFIGLGIALERLRVENKVDICQTVKSLRRQRPFMVQTVAQYQFCYQAVVDFLRSFDYVV